ncbi:MAG: NusG domain II-containing protein [Faecalibacterium sp.]
MKLSPLKQNIIFIAVILLIAAIWFGAQTYRNHLADTSAQDTSLYYAEVHIAAADGNIVTQYSLDQDGFYDIETESGYTIHLEVLDGAIRFVNSPCPDHICETYGWINYENQFAICAPSGVTVIITPKS